MSGKAFTALLGILLFLIGCNGDKAECLSVPLVLVNAGGSLTPEHYLASERIVGAQVTIAWANDLIGRSLEEYLEEFGEPHGTSSDSGRIDIDLCGHTTRNRFSQIWFEPDYRFAVLGVERSEGGPLEVVVLEFRSPSITTVRPIAGVVGAVGETLDVATPAGDVLLPIEG
jgi:hypothetical protein